MTPEEDPEFLIFEDRWEKFIVMMNDFQKNDEITDDEMMRLVCSWMGPMMKIMDFQPETVSRYMVNIFDMYDRYEVSGGSR
jgi:hypothetical protein